MVWHGHGRVESVDDSILQEKIYAFLYKLFNLYYSIFSKLIFAVEKIKHIEAPPKAILKQFILFIHDNDKLNIVK